MEFIVTSNIVDDILDTLYPDSIRSTYVAHLNNVTPATPNFELLRPLFGWMPADTIKRTFEVTTQYACGRVSDTLKQHCVPAFQHAMLNVTMNRSLLTLSSVIHLRLTAVSRVLNYLSDVIRWLRMFMV